MDIRPTIVAESGEAIMKPEDGFIIAGNIYTAKVNKDGHPEGDLIGHSFSGNTVVFYSQGQAVPSNHSLVKLKACTKIDLLIKLGYKIKDLEEAIKVMKENPRHF